MIMKKFYLLAAVALVALASCTSDEFVGDNGSPNTGNNNGSGAISFNSGSKAITRATGAEAAKLLNNNFVVEGIKTINSTKSEVFDNYNVNYLENTADKTASNTANWEYVAQTILTGKTAAAEQTIKYWDFAAKQYDFWAYSLGNYTTGSLTVSSLEPNATLGTSAYTIEGTKDDLANVYISDLVTAYNPNTEVSGLTSAQLTTLPNMGNEVKLSFRSLVTKVRVGLYETIPGYSVENVEFYPSDNGTATSTVSLYTSSSVLPSFPSSGTSTYTVTFPTTGISHIGESDYNKAHVTFPNDGTKASKLEFGTLSYGAKLRDNVGTATNWLMRSSSQPSWAVESGATAGDYSIVMPYETGAVLTLKLNYTLRSTDGTDETITVHGATALVPAQYTQWKPNYAYTYLFKISDNTNGLTNPAVTDKKGLYPITLDAIVVGNEEGTQETITTVAAPSITTYSTTSHVTDDNEYAASDIIYATTTEDGSLITMSSTNAWLYSLSGKSDYTEADVLAALTKYVSNDGPIVGRNDVTLTAQGSPIITLTETELPLVDGNKITGLIAGQLAKFSGLTAGSTYAFVYQKTAGGEAVAQYEAVTLTSSDDVTQYFTKSGDVYSAATTPFDANATYYARYYTVANAVYAIKVIKIKA